MSYRFKELSIRGLYTIELHLMNDARGSVCKEYDKNIFLSNGVEFIPQESLIITSKKNVLRGLHLQIVKEQDRLVRCISGKVWSVVLDLRNESETQGKWLQVNINNGNEVYIPKGCAFGTLALEDSQILCMFGANSYDSKYSTGVRWDDEILAIKWPEFANIRVSEKDRNLLSYNNFLRDILI